MSDHRGRRSVRSKRIIARIFHSNAFRVSSEQKPLSQAIAQAPMSPGVRPAACRFESMETAVVHTGVCRVCVPLHKTAEGNSPTGGSHDPLFAVRLAPSCHTARKDLDNGGRCVKACRFPRRLVGIER